MDVDAFLAAQLWLRRLPAEAWPVADRNAHGSGGVVILARAKCCFLLEDRPSAQAPPAPPPPRVRSSSSDTNTRGTRGDSGSPRSPKRARPLWFSARGAAAGCAVEPSALSAETSSNLGASDVDRRPPGASNNRRHDPDEAEKDAGSLFGGCSAPFQLDNSSTVRSRGEGQRARGKVTQLGAAAEAGAKDAIQVPLQREFDFGLAISRPRSEGHGGDDAWNDGRPQAPRGGGALLLRIGAAVFQAEHTLIRSIAYPRGGGGCRGRGAGSSDTAGGNGNATNGRSREGSPLNRGGDSGADGRGKSPPVPTAAAARGTAGLPPLRPPAAPVTTEANRTVDASAADGAGGIADARCRGVGFSHGRRPDGGDQRRRFVDGGRIVASAAGTGDEGATDGVAAAQPRCLDGGEGGVEEGVPFCGLFFPGVLLKFWLPQRPGNPVSTRAEAVARMQGVVSKMMAGLSASTRYGCSRGDGGGIVAPGVDAIIPSVVAEGKENGFRPRLEAWDEFVYGSHVLLRREHTSIQQHRGGGGGGDAGGISGPRTCSRCSDAVGIGAPALAGQHARGHEDSRLEDDGPSDVGRARALTCLAECFSKASLPSSVKLSVERQLQDEAASAGRELEEGLERAFPLDLSQGTDASTRFSLVSELEASLHRVQAARKAALTLSLLPASEMLDESGDSG
eukprot:g8249.t1